MRAIGGIDVDLHQSRARTAELEINPLRAIRRPDADPVAGPQPDQPARGALDFLRQFAPLQPDVLMPDKQGVALRKPLHGLPEDLMSRQAGELQVGTAGIAGHLGNSISRSRAAPASALARCRACYKI